MGYNGCNCFRTAFLHPTKPLFYVMKFILKAPLLVTGIVLCFLWLIATGGKLILILSRKFLLVVGVCMQILGFTLSVLIVAVVTLLQYKQAAYITLRIGPIIGLTVLAFGT